MIKLERRADVKENKMENKNLCTKREEKEKTQLSPSFNNWSSLCKWNNVIKQSVRFNFFFFHFFVHPTKPTTDSEKKFEWNNLNWFNYEKKIVFAMNGQITKKIKFQNSVHSNKVKKRELNEVTDERGY